MKRAGRAGAAVIALVLAFTGAGLVAAPAASAASVPLETRSVAAEPGDRSLTVNWAASYDGGSPITAYEVSVAATSPGSGPGTVTAVPGNTLRLTVDGLTNGVTYMVSICSVNAVGRSMNCPAAPRWVTAGAPGVPEGLTATQRPDGALRLSWSAADAHGAAPTTYQWSASPDGASGVLDVASWRAEHPDSSDGSFWVDVPGQRAGIKSQYQVLATNQFGSGFESILQYTPHWTKQLPAGAAMFTGNELRSANGRYTAVLQRDGNMVVYAAGNRPLWHSHTWSNVETMLEFQDDGNLVLSDALGWVRWHSATWGNPGARLVMQDDGNLVLYAANGTPLWFTGWDRGPGAADDTLWSRQQLTGGQSLTSRSGKFTLRVQTDGNVVLYGSDQRALWNTWTFAGAWFWHDNRLRLQPDGNLVVYEPDGRAAWHAGTWGNANVRLVMQDDGNLVIYAATGRALWSSMYGRTY